MKIRNRKKVRLKRIRNIHPKKPMTHIKASKPKWRCPKELLELLEIQKKLYTNFKENVERMESTIDSYNVHLHKTHEILDRAEDTVCNVLLAIRQNEYLQAWYPAQQGHSEGKIVGNHPLGAVNRKYTKNE